MYEQSAKWNSYYDEIDPAKRKELMNDAMMNEADDGANAMRLKLFNMRYVDPKNSEYIDRFLWQCVNLTLVYKATHIFKSAGERDLKKALKELGFDMISEAIAAADDDTREALEKAYYWEVRNTVKRYLATTQNGAYRRKFFGLVSANDEERGVQSLKDIWEMSVGVSVKYHMEEEMKLWNSAVYDAYIVSEADGISNFRQYDEAHRVKL